MKGLNVDCKFLVPCIDKLDQAAFCSVNSVQMILSRLHCLVIALLFTMIKVNALLIPVDGGEELCLQIHVTGTLFIV